MAQIAVVYHSGYGQTMRMAQAVAEGASATLIAIDAEGNLPEGGWDTLNAADAIIMGSPTYTGAVSWQFKKFAEASSRPWYSKQWKNKVFAGFTNNISMHEDKLSSLHYMFTLAMRHCGIWVGSGLKPKKNKAAQRKNINYVGHFSGAMTHSPLESQLDDMLSGDIKTAKSFGKRIAEVTTKINLLRTPRIYPKAVHRGITALKNKTGELCLKSKVHGSVPKERRSQTQGLT